MEIKAESIKQREQRCGFYGQLLQENLLESELIPLNSHTVKTILDELLKQDKPTLNDSARCLEVENIHHLIGNKPLFPPGMVGMSPSLARSWVLLALRKSGIQLGVESEFDKLFLRLMPDLQRLNSKQNTEFHSNHLSKRNALSPYKVFVCVAKILKIKGKKI